MVEPCFFRLGIIDNFHYIQCTTPFLSLASPFALSQDGGRKVDIWQISLLSQDGPVYLIPCSSYHCILSQTWHHKYMINSAHSYTPHTPHACCSQSKFRILKIRKSSTRALFLYNCTPNISRSADASVSVA